MSRKSPNPVNKLIIELFDAGTNISCAHGAPTPEDFQRLTNALIAIEEGVIVDGEWRLESLLDGDLKAISRLLQRAAQKG